ncbi:tRNA (guanosine(46)-N7)-methyltransferase TrmB [Buchnera aphidicola]|uniref:tRNA (guanine-N(7)-)-methyltransferase n=1 Tax=Buchnera aphidicola (Sarucallis kahawaluokalani) TaxID=1241878 RepID=A0A4D6YJK8_9GAMM|nr:tRNA (guanosine(46)-N7)-methyltransferase TrmB [Buchnera aphidicola]QCI26154.1 tRNA (guanosine(46)-N7)-methyltransferase TrmB [Buchnera aphidicola (Sarucallis kahawaluokalani)]
MYFRIKNTFLKKGDKPFMENILIKKFITPKYNKAGTFLRQIHSFNNRYRPLNKYIIEILQKNWYTIGISFKNRLIDLDTEFHKKKLPIILEIGFGYGENLLNTAINYPEYNVLGIEVYVPGVSFLIEKIYLLNIKINNIKIIVHDAVEVLQSMIHDRSIHIIQLFFPDPWPKRCHHKRRILQLEFIQLIQKKLIYNGILHIVTDCTLYVQHITNIISNMNNVINLSNIFNYVYFKNIVQNTRFGKKAILKKNKIFHLIFRFQ